MLRHESVLRKYHLIGIDFTSSSGYTAEWEEFPPEVVKAFVNAFNESNGRGFNSPYVQFYVSPKVRGAVCVISLAGYDGIGTVSLARGKIRPSETSSAIYNEDGSVTFTNVRIELTAGEHRDRPLVAASVVITSSGEMHVTE